MISFARVFAVTAVIGVGLLAGPCAAAVGCSLIITPIDFASVDPSGSHSDALGTLRVDCSVTAAPGPGTLPLTLKFSPGKAGNFSGSRVLTRTSGVGSLNYQIYTSVSRLPGQVWGDGTGSTSIVTATVAGLASLASAGSVTVTAYGRVFGSQGFKAAGTYTDNLTITVDF